MLQTMASPEDVRPVYLFYGSSDLDSMTFINELESLEGEMNLKFVPVLQQPVQYD
jgi:hypothetical protein